MPLPDYSHPLEYWDQRHREFSEARAGGDLGLSDATNEVFYQIRLGMLLRLIEHHLPPTDKPIALDAGCGKGFFADALVRCGYQVHAIDASPAAIAFCKHQRKGQYQISDLTSFAHPYLFDIVYCIDVMFHITNDLLWSKGFTNLASLTALSGIFVLTDLNCQRRITLGDYIAHRPYEEYISIADDFRGNSVGFYVFKRRLGGQA
jgi:2-polyprenyl-3-methyl-5-hydroxy-6-metoxy-1,4-benzoquinol methylase